MKRTKTIISTINKNDCLWRSVFLTGVCVLFFGWGMNSSNYALYSFWKSVSHAIQILGCGILLPLAIRNIINQKSQVSKNNLLLYLALIIVTIISVIVSKNKSVAYTLLIIVSSLTIPFNFSAKAVLISQVISFLFIVLSFYIGAIDETIISRGSVVRHSLGTVSPNYLMMLVFGIIANILVIKRHASVRFSLVIGVLVLLVLVFVYSITDSRMGLIAGIAIVAMYIIKSNKYLNNIIKKTKVVMLLLPTLLLLATVVVTALYGVGNLNGLNGVLSNRLELNRRGFEEWGITLLGNDIKYIGQTYEHDIPEGYNYIDSAYLNVMFECGALYLLVMLAYLWCITDRLYDSKEYYLIVLLSIFEIYALVDGCLFSVSTNIILLYGFNKESFRETARRIAESKKDRIGLK